MNFVSELYGNPPLYTKGCGWTVEFVFIIWRTKSGVWPFKKIPFSLKVPDFVLEL